MKIEAKSIIVEISKENTKVHVRWIHSQLIGKEVLIGDEFTIGELILRESLIFFDPLLMRDRSEENYKKSLKDAKIKIIKTDPKGKVKITKDTKLEIKYE